MLVIPSMLFWVIMPAAKTLGYFHRTFWMDALVFIDTASLVLWLKYREHLFRATERKETERWLFHMLGGLSLVWVVMANLFQGFWETLYRDAPYLGICVRAAAAFILGAYMWLWGSVMKDPVLENGREQDEQLNDESGG